MNDTKSNAGEEKCNCYPREGTNCQYDKKCSCKCHIGLEELKSLLPDTLTEEQKLECIARVLEMRLKYGEEEFRKAVKQICGN